jgi:kinesin family protein 5
MRAKSIKNTARVNAELSPAELKGLLKKAQAANSAYATYLAALESELAQWRAGAVVDQSEWALPEKSGAAGLPGAGPPAPGTGKRTPASPPPTGTSRSMTPINPTIESLRGVLDSRPQTPTVLGLEKDEREEFLKRENELSDQLAEKVRMSLCDSHQCCLHLPSTSGICVSSTGKTSQGNSRGAHVPS